MNWLRRVIVFSTLILFFWGSERFVHQRTEGFTLLNIWDSYSFDPKWEPSSAQNWEKASIALNQKFYFLRAGGQNYAFISEDKNYVLKVTKYKRMRIPIWIEPLPLPKRLAGFREKKIEKKKRILDATFASYLIAFDHLRDFSGIVYLHLNQTDDLDQKLVLVDLLGVEHPIDLDRHAFILQKKGTLTFAYFDNLIVEKSEEKAKVMLEKITRYVAHRISLCIEDHDIGFGTNFGILDDEPFQLDIGSLRFNPGFTTPEAFCSKLSESMEDLRVWLRCTHPNLLKAVDESISQIQKERMSGVTSFYPTL